MPTVKSVAIRKIPGCILLALLCLPTAQLRADAAGQWRDGKHVYEKICSYCHDTAIGTNLKDYARPPEYIHYVVRNGLRAMPAFRATEIDDKALDKLADYVTSMPKN